MANYAIMRCEKIKSRASLTRALQHNTRERIPRNAKTDIKERVMTLYSNDMANYEDAFKNARKNAVYGVEWLFTASDMSNIDLNQWGKDNLEWVAKEMGKENILNASIHLDETTPHMHILVVPRYNDKLNCRHYLGGTKYKMRELQDNYFDRVGINYDLQRGQDKVKTNTYHDKHDLSKINKKIQEKEKILENIEKKIDFFEKDRINNFNLSFEPPKTKKSLLNSNNLIVEEKNFNSFLDNLQEMRQNLIRYSNNVFKTLQEKEKEIEKEKNSIEYIKGYEAFEKDDAIIQKYKTNFEDTMKEINKYKVKAEGLQEHIDKIDRYMQKQFNMDSYDFVKIMKKNNLTKGRSL